MRKIQKTISLEPMTSRLPSVLPAYLDNKLYFFDDASLKVRKYEHTSNWGMVPVNIVLKHNPSEGVEYNQYALVSGTHCYGNSNYDKFESFTLSFDTLSKWYYFFEEYYNLLNSYGHCSMAYSSATEYYANESKSKFISQMVYGTDEQRYIDLDAEFAEKGGKVTAVTNNFKTSYVDVGFYKWICDNIVPRFIIPFEYRDYWNRTTLFYPDVIKELAWFAQRLHYETDANYSQIKGDVPTWNCKNEHVDDCCDCEKYFGKGGRRTYDAMKSWYDALQEKIISINNFIKSSEICFIPTIILPTELQNSVDDLGEFSIFSKDFQLGTDYRTVEGISSGGRTVIRYDSGNTHSGTVVTMNGNSMILNSGSGSHYDETYMEAYATSCTTCGYYGAFSDVCPRCGSKNINTIDWSSYTEKYINGNREDFVVNQFKHYCFTEDNRKVTWSGATNDELLKKLCGEIYQVESANSMYVNGVLYPIYKREYGIYDMNDPYLSGNTYFVYREKETDTPYVVINGKKTYGTLYYSGTTKPVYYFTFFKVKNNCCENNECESNKCKKGESYCNNEIFRIDDFKTFPRFYSSSNNDKEYIVYNGLPYIINNDNEIPSLSVIVDSSLIYRVDGTFTDRLGDNYYCSGSTIYKGEGVPIEKCDNTECKRIDINVDSLGKTDSYMYCYEGTLMTPSQQGNCCIIYKDISDIITYDVKMVTGKTASKIYDLRSQELLVDDAGQTIEGVYKVRPSYVDDDGNVNIWVEKYGKKVYNIKQYSQPPQNEEIEPIYQVGNTANIKRFRMTIQDEDKIGSDNTNYFVGDIIEEMIFYYVDSNENVIEGTKFSAGGQYSSLDAIKESTQLKESVESTIVVLDDIRCDITYYIGATLSRKKDEKYKLAEGYNHGVKYTETVKFVKTPTKYYLRVPSKKVLPIRKLIPMNNNLYIPIYTYKLEQDKTRIDSHLYESRYDVALADFEAIIPLMTLNNGNVKNEFDDWEDMAKRNNMEVFPVFREEYKLGISTIEKIDSDIYIDRGVSASFEKHLKLGEVYSLEALEQFGNGYFKIMEV